jgi:hypothetical protein
LNFGSRRPCDKAQGGNNGNHSNHEKHDTAAETTGAVLLCSITVFRNWSVSCLCHGKERSSGFFCVEIFVTLMNLSPIFHGGALMT